MEKERMYWALVWSRRFGKTGHFGRLTLREKVRVIFLRNRNCEFVWLGTTNNGRRVVVSEPVWM